MFLFLSLISPRFLTRKLQHRILSFLCFFFLSRSWSLLSLKLTDTLLHIHSPSYLISFLDFYLDFAYKSRTCLFGFLSFLSSLLDAPYEPLPFISVLLLAYLLPLLYPISLSLYLSRSLARGPARNEVSVLLSPLPFINSTFVRWPTSLPRPEEGHLPTLSGLREILRLSAPSPGLNQRSPGFFSFLEERSRAWGEARTEKGKMERAGTGNLEVRD